MRRASRHLLPGQLWHIAFAVDGTCTLHKPRDAYTNTLGTESSALGPEDIPTCAEYPVAA